MPRGQQHARQQRDAPLLEFLHPNGRGDVRPVFDQRFSREQTGGMRVRAHAAVHRVEARQFAGRQAKEPLDVFDVARRRVSRSQLRVHAMNVGAGESAGSQPGVLSQLEIALRIRGRHPTFVHPEQMHALPVEVGAREHLKHPARRRSSGNRQRRQPLFLDRLAQPFEYLLGARIGGRRGVGELSQVVRHVKIPCQASTRSNTGSRPRMDNSSRIKHSSESGGSRAE